MIYAKIGAVLYLLWGVLHVIAAQKVYMLSQTLEPGMVQGRIVQDAFFLLFFALLGMVVAGALNWKNSRQGYWINLIGVSAADIGFIVAILIPGYLPLFPGLVGPILWILAVAFSTAGIMKKLPHK